MADLVDIVAIDDKLAENYRESLKLACGPLATRTEWRGRRFHVFGTLEEATVLLDWEEPFVLILDHNMQAGLVPEQPELADALGVTASDCLNPVEPQIEGFHLCKALRQRHPLGLIIPVVYNTAYMKSDAFLRMLALHGPFLPDFWVDGNNETPVDELVETLDAFYDKRISVMRQAADMLFARDVELLDAPGDTYTEGYDDQP